MSADPLADETRRNAAVALIRHLYVDLEQPTGGPLHVQLDDGNLGDYWVSEEANRGRYNYLFDGSFERWSQAGDNVSHERKCAIRDTCEGILHLLRQMDERERHVAVADFWYWWRPSVGERMREALEAEDEDEPEAPEGASGSSKSCVSIPCPPFTEVNLQASWRSDDEDEYSPQAQPTAADLVRAGVDIDRFHPQHAESPDLWEPEDPLLVKLYDARLAALDAESPTFRLHEMMESALRSTPEARAAALVPRIITLPDGVTPEQAMEWIRGCERLGLIEPNEAGTLLLPPGVL